MSCLSLCTLLLSWSLTTAPSLLWQPEFKLLALYHNNNTENNNNVYARDCSKSLTFIIVFSILTPSLWRRLCYFSHLYQKLLLWTLIFMLFCIFSFTPCLFSYPSSFPFFSSIPLYTFHQAGKEEHSWQQNSTNKVKED